MIHKYAMNTELFIARRLLKGKATESNYSKPIVNIAILGIALGLAVMILSMAIVTGFKKEITDKVSGFGAHIQVTHFDNNSSYETYPVEMEQDWLKELRQMEAVKSVYPFITKAGIIKTTDYLQGVVLKGIEKEFDWVFFNKHMVEGNILNISDTAKNNGILISKNISRRLSISTGDAVCMFFIQDPPRMRKFKVKGIYNTQLEEMDNVYVFCDIKHLQKLNNWDSTQISGYEILIHDFDALLDTDLAVTKLIGDRFTPGNEVLQTENVLSRYPQIFDWLNLQDVNVWVILTLMVLVAGFNMVSGLLVIILERTNMIGVLKSLGAENFGIRKLFLYHAGFLITKGLLWGNIIGIGLCLLQSQFGLIHLDPTSYYVSTVPINLKVLHILLLNFGSLLVTLIMLIVPSMLISRISPAKAIQFD